MNSVNGPSLYFHTFWTRPQFVDEGRTPSDPIELPEFEALTWLTSALEARRHGRLRLYTDLRGQEFIRNVGLEWVYSGGISIELENVPKGIDPAVFWAAGKLFAWSAVSEPAVSLDPDAICWAPVAATAPVVVLHPEDPGSEDYRHQQDRYANWGFHAPDWDWAVEPANTGVLMIADPGFAHRYAAESIRFMAEYSDGLRSGVHPRPNPVSSRSDTMIFAEQRLLSMMLRREGMRGAALTAFDSRRQHQCLDSPCLHLWGTKQFYQRCRDARVVYVNHLIDHVARNFPEAVETLERWKLDRPIQREQLPPDPVAPFPLENGQHGYCRLGRIHGSIEIQDANLQVRRPGYPGAMVGTAEILHPQGGCSFELTEVRRSYESADG